jgi:hypothetical protein
MPAPAAPTVNVVTTGTGAQYAATDGRVWLTKGGKFYSAAPDKLDDVYGQLGEGARPATPEEVAARLEEKRHDTLSGKVATVIENVGTGAVSAAAAPARAIALAVGNDADAKDYTGESFFKNLAGAYAHVTSGGDLNKLEEAQDEFTRGVQARRSLYPTLAGASQAAGEIAQVAATGGLSAAPELIAGRSAAKVIGGAAVAGAAENALLSTGQEAGQAVIENRDIDRERIAADGLHAAILGAALGGGGAAIGKGVKAIAKRFIGTGLDEAGAGDRAAERKAGAPGTLEESLAETHANAAKSVDAAGVNPIAREEAATAQAEKAADRAAAADPSDWRKMAKKADALELYTHRDAVLDGATRDASDDLNKVLDRQKPIYDEIDNLTAKRGKVAEHMAADGVDETAALQRAQDDASVFRGRLEEVRAQTSARRAELHIPENAEGAANDALAPKRIKPGDAEKAIRSVDVVLRETERNLAKVDNAADGVIAVDSMRRELYKLYRRTSSLAKTSASFEERTLLEPVRDFLQQEYQRAADSLMDASFVGTKQAAAQSAVNTARVGSINGEMFDLRGFVNQVGSREGAAFGGKVF